MSNLQETEEMEETEERQPEQQEKKVKARTIVGIVVLAVCAAISVLGFVFHDAWFAETGWCMTYNSGSELLNTVLRFLPRIVRSVQVITVTLILLYAVCGIINKIFKNTPRRVTIAKLVNSIIKVVLWVACIIAVLAVWGFNVAALVAGAGVLTLIIGLGMQSLIADVVAGIFLVCDGTLQVGDIVTIDGWRGTVLEIGVRNTKLINYSGDIRITNNSQIKTFINQSRENSYPTTTISITYEEDIRRVEKLFAEHRKELKKQLPLVLDGPDYKGVAKLSDSSVDLLFGATCKEADFAQTTRDLNRVLRIFFMEHDIAIPYPQLDIHTPDEKPQKKQ